MELELTTAPGVGLPRPIRQARGWPRRTGIAQLISYRPALALIALVSTFLVLQWLLPLGEAIKIGADEDYELAKATLCNHGYKLYSEIWNDQPPLITTIIAQLAKHAPNPILAPRLMTVGFSVVLLVAMFVFVRALSGTLAASIATALLIGSPGFLELSSSAMQEIPAFAPIVASLALLWLGPPARYWCTALLAGFVFGFALQMKLIGVAYLPIAALILWLRADLPVVNGTRRNLRETKAFCIGRLVRVALAFGMSIIATFIVLNFLTGNSLALQLQQSWAAHFAQAKSFEYGSPEEHGFDWTLLLKNWDITVPALVGTCILLARCRKTWEASIPLAWLWLSFVVFGTHKPWWPYYYIHNAIPLSWCAGVAISAGYEWLHSRFARRTKKREAGMAMLARKERRIQTGSKVVTRPWYQAMGLGVMAVCQATWIGSRISLEEKAIRTAPRLDSALALKEIERFKPFTKFMFSDQPIYSFHADLPMPPHLAVISLKRLWTGDLSNAGLTAELEAVKPGIILLGKASQQVPYEELLAREYRLVYQDSNNRLYAHESIAKKPPL